MPDRLSRGPSVRSAASDPRQPDHCVAHHGCSNQLHGHERRLHWLRNRRGSHGNYSQGSRSEAVRSGPRPHIRALLCCWRVCRRLLCSSLNVCKELMMAPQARSACCRLPCSPEYPSLLTLAKHMQAAQLSRTTPFNLFIFHFFRTALFCFLIPCLWEDNGSSFL